MSVEADVPDALLKLAPVTLRPYETRVGSVAAARRINTKLSTSDQGRSRLRAMVKGMLDGNPPYSPAERRKHGLKWTANLNFMQAEAAVDSARTPYYDLITGSKELVDCCTSHDKQNPDWSRWNERITVHYDWLLKSWDSFYTETWNEQYWMLVGGMAINLFNETGWKWRALSPSCAKVPQRSPAALNDRLPYIIIQLNYTLTELYEMVRNEDAAKVLGFDVDLMKKTIINSDSTNGPNNLSWKDQPWEEWQRRLNAHDIEGDDMQDVTVCHFYVREFADGEKKGKISHFMFTANPVLASQGIGVEETGDDFLRKDPNKYETYDEALVGIFQNTADGFWHSVKGMAEKGFKHWDAINKLMCKTLDNSFLRSSLILDPVDQTDSDKMQLIVRSDVTILPQGTKVQQFQHAGDIEGSMAVNRMMNNHLANNLGVYNQRTLTREDGRGEQPTATQVEMQATKEATLSNGQIGLYYLGRDRLYTSAFKKAVESTDEDAREFRRRCEADGVPEEALKKMEYVRCNRSSGYGSQQMKKINLGAIGSIAQQLPEEGKDAYLDDFISAYAGIDKVDKYNPKQQQPMPDDALATLENSTLRDGIQPVIFSGQNAVNHLQIHLNYAIEIISPLKEAADMDQPDPQAMADILPYVRVLIPHMEEHLMQIQNDPSRVEIFKLVQLQLKNLVAFSKEMFGILRDTQRQMQIEAQQQQQANALGAMDQAKLASAQQDMQLKLAKTLHGEQLKDIKLKGSEQRQNAKTAADIQRGAVTTASDIQLNRFKTLSNERNSV